MYIKNDDNISALAECTVQSAGDSVSYKFAKEDFRIRLVAYLVMRTTSRASSCSASVRLISITRFDWKVLYIRMTCGSYRAMQSYAPSCTEIDVRGVREERYVRVSVQFPMLVAKKSPRDSK